MSKVIFTDFFGTLVTQEIKKNTVLQDEEYKFVRDLLRYHLNRKNHLVIASSIEGTPLTDYVKMIERLTKSFAPETLENLSFYLIDSHTHFQKIGSYKLSDETPFLHLIKGNKEDVVNLFIATEKIKKEDTLVSAGESKTDIDLLYRIHAMGGTSYFVSNRHQNEIKRLSTKELREEVAAKQTIIMAKEEMDDETRCETCASIYNELLKKEYSDLDREILEKMHCLLSLTQEYNFFYPEEKRRNYVTPNTLDKKLILVKDRKDIFYKLKY